MIGPVLAMSFYNRPDYARQALASLAGCDGVADARLVACVEPGCEETRALVEAVDFLDCRRIFNPRRLGANRNIRQCFEEALRWADYVIYLEEDTLLAADALRFFAYCDRRWRASPEVFSATGYHRADRCDADRYHAVARRQWFHPWGCALWRDRLAPAFSRWPGPHEPTWDVYLNHQVREPRGLVEVHPLLSRVQNIGAHGSYVPGPAWHRQHQHVSLWAAQLALPPADFHDV